MADTRNKRAGNGAERTGRKGARVIAFAVGVEVVTEEGVPRGESPAAGVAGVRDASAPRRPRRPRAAPRGRTGVVRWNAISDRSVRGDSAVVRADRVRAGDV